LIEPSSVLAICGQRNCAEAGLTIDRPTAWVDLFFGRRQIAGMDAAGILNMV
jgi:hypothetical protein